MLRNGNLHIKYLIKINQIYKKKLRRLKKEDNVDIQNRKNSNIYVDLYS
jgi:hypothetical protein